MLTVSQLSFPVGSEVTEAAAACVEFRLGEMKFPAAFCTVPNVIRWMIPYASSTYPIENAFPWMTPATPSLPFAPRPTGQFTEVPLPGPLAHSGLTFDR